MQMLLVLAAAMLLAAFSSDGGNPLDLALAALKSMSAGG